MKSMWCVAAMSVGLLAACGPNSNQVATETKAVNPPVASVPVPMPAASAVTVATLPQSCQQLLDGIEKCVIKYETSAAADALTFRMEFEQLKGQITRGTDAQALEQACTESHHQMTQMPEMQC